MSDSFGYEVTADGSKALQVSKDIEASLANIEGAAKQTGAAIGTNLNHPALKNAQGQYVATSMAAQKMKQTVNDLVAQWAKQDEMLERINGPVKNYDAGLRALDQLLEDNTISTKEYADQVARLNGELSKSQPRRVGEEGEEGEKKHLVEGNIGEELNKNVGGEFGEALDGLITKGNIEAGVLAGMAIEAVHLGDEYIELTNKAIKFADATHSVDQVLNDQLDVAGQLHGNLDQTLEIYDNVHDVAEELNLTYADQIRMTKSVGEVVQLSGKSLDTAAGLMQRLSFAMQSGSLTGRDLKAMMKEFPELADLWTVSLGKSKQQIIAMADSGKLSAKTLIAAFGPAGEELDKKFGKRTETVGQAWEHFKDTLVVTIGKFVEATGIITILTTVINVLTTVLNILASIAGAVSDALGFLNDTLGDLVGTVTDFAADMVGLGSVLDEAREKANVDKWDAYFKKFGAGITIVGNLTNKWMDWIKASGFTPPKPPDIFKDLDRVTNMLDTLESKGAGVFAALGIAEDGWNSKLTITAQAMKIVTDEGAKVGAGKETIEALKKAWDTNTISVDAYISKMKEAGAAAAGGQLPGFMKEDLTMKQAYADMEDLRITMGSTTTGAARLKAEYEQLATTLNGGELPAAIKQMDAIHDPTRVFNNDLTALNRLLDAGKISWEQYDIQLQKVLAEDPSPLGQLITRLNKTQEDQTRGLATVTEAYATGKVDLSLYNDELDRLGITLGRLDSVVNPTKNALPFEMKAPKPEELDISKLQNKQKDLSISFDYQAVLPKPDEGYKMPAPDFTEVSSAFLEIERKKVVYDKIMGDSESTTKYKDELRTLGDALREGSISQTDYNSKVRELKDGYDDMAKPIDKFADEVDLAHQKLVAGIYTLTEYNKKIKLLRESLDGKSFADGLVEGMKKIKEEVGDVGSIVSSTMVKAFDQINTSLEDMVETGKMDFDSLGKAFEKMLVEMALKMLESQILSAFMPGAGGGGGLTGAIVAAAGGGGVPGHATGTQYIVGGPSGTDQSLQAFWATKGERVTVETKNQQAQRDGATASSPQPVIIQNRNYLGDDEMIGSMGGRKGDRVVMNSMRRNPSAARAVLGASQRR